MIKIKKDDASTRRNIGKLAAIALLVIVLTVFCKSMDYPLILPLLLVAMGCHLVLCNRGEQRLFLNLGLLVALILATAQILKTYTTLPSYYTPVAGIAMLTMLLFNSRQLSFVMSFVSSIVVAFVFDGGLPMMLTFFLGSLIGAYSVREARTRGRLIISGFLTSIINVICLVLFNPYPNVIMSKVFLMESLYPLALNGFVCAFLVAATLKVFEYLFGVLTNYSLLELSDFNQPLLRRMILEAPGTYHHSLVVSNLAEAAADAIGAHALLTRVGAYYHDIGKMAHPEYFTENQLMGGNKHDNIEPSMSRLVILNHVKEGIEMAKKNKLNPRIIDFIPQHHGTSLIYFFYQKSVEAAEEGEIIDEENFRYPGPKPQKRETAIVLMADSVEGATRALDEQNPQSIQETVQKVVNNKFIDGQLDECPLTLKEIEKISSTFTRILTAMYHGRVKYPEKKNGNSNRKPAEKNPSQSGSPQDNHQDAPKA